MKIRYPLASLYFMAGLILSMIALFNGLSVYNDYILGLKAKEMAAYPSEVCINISNAQEMDKQSLNELCEDKLFIDANVKLSGIKVKNNNSGSSWNLIIILKNSIPERIWTVDGTIFSFPDNESEPVAAAGRYVCDSALTENGRQYLYLENQNRFLLTAVLGSNTNSFQGGLIVIQWKDIPDDWMPLISQQEGIQLQLQSNTYIEDSLVQSVADKLQYFFPKAELSAKRQNQSSTEQVVMRTSRLSVSAWMYVFCALILMQISALWVKTRKKELLVRKIFGYSNVKIMLYLSKNLIFLMIISVTIYFCGQSAVDFSVIQKIQIEDIRIAILYFSVTMIICLIIPFWWIRHWSCTELLNERQG